MCVISVYICVLWQLLSLYVASYLLYQFHTPPLRAGCENTGDLQIEASNPLPPGLNRLTKPHYVLRPYSRDLTTRIVLL